MASDNGLRIGLKKHLHLFYAIWDNVLTNGSPSHAIEIAVRMPNDSLFVARSLLNPLIHEKVDNFKTFKNKKSHSSFIAPK